MVIHFLLRVRLLANRFALPQTSLLSFLALSSHMTSSYAFATLDEVQNIIKEHGKRLSHYGLPQPNLPYHETLMEVERWSHDTTTLTGKSAPNALAWHITKNAMGSSSIAREEVVTSPWDNNMGICRLIVSQDEPHIQPLSPCSDVH